MSTLRTAYRFLAVSACAAAAVLACSAPAFAWDAPALSGPAAGSSVSRSQSITFTWSGARQGDPDTLDRSFFRVQVALAADVPANPQAAWPTVVNSIQTDPGADTTSVKMGAPDAGSYRWRVCAWGVENDLISNDLQQLECSSSRAFTSTEVSSNRGDAGVVTVDEHRTVQGADRVVERERIVKLPALAAENRVVTVKLPGGAELSYGDLSRVTGGAFAGAGGDSSVNLGEDGLDLTSEDEGINGMFGPLGKSIPGVPIPFWTLLLLGVPIAAALWWRKSALAMFDTPPDAGELSDLEAGVKDEAGDADGAHRSRPEGPPGQAAA